jgi:Protein of unknown function (DUF5818)
MTMHRALVIAFTISIFLALSQVPLNAQSSLTNTAQEAAPTQLFTSDLIAWTEMQTPEPIPATSPKTSSPTTSQKPPSAQPQPFTGIIRKEGNTYVLWTSDKWFYDLDDQSTAAIYENQRVAVIGRLNLTGDLIHVQTISPAS